MHTQKTHETTQEGPSEDEKVEKPQTEIGQSEEALYKCSICEFETTHNPGLKSHMTKCIHSGKYKNLAQLIDEANP